MKALLRRMGRFLATEDGPTAVEYAVMLALIMVVCLAAVKTIGTNAQAAFTKVGASIAGS
jgi:pilus assembly protein Flp/PilA